MRSSTRGGKRRWVFGAAAGVVIGAQLGCATHRRLVAQDEKVVLNDLLAIQKAEAAYSALTGAYGTLDCLAAPWDCLPGYPRANGWMLDPRLASLASDNGYERRFHPGPAGSVGGLASWAYTAVPVKDTRNRKAFCVDMTTRICVTYDAKPPRVAEGLCALPCERIR